MKYANKMMLVPYQKPLEQPKETKLLELDSEMSNVLKTSTTYDDKIKLYNQALSKFIKQYDASTIGMPPAMVELVQKLNQFLASRETKPIETKPEIKQEPVKQEEPTTPLEQSPTTPLEQPLKLSPASEPKSKRKLTFDEPKEKTKSPSPTKSAKSSATKSPKVLPTTTSKSPKPTKPKAKNPRQPSTPDPNMPAFNLRRNTINTATQEGNGMCWLKKNFF